MYERAFNMLLYIDIPMFVELFKSVSRKKGQLIFWTPLLGDHPVTVCVQSKHIMDLGFN